MSIIIIIIIRVKLKLKLQFGSFLFTAAKMREIKKRERKNDEGQNARKVFDEKLFRGLLKHPISDELSREKIVQKGLNISRRISIRPPTNECDPM